LLAVSLGAGPSEGETEAGPPAADNASPEVFIDPLGPNAACYVCHQTFIFEEMATVHKAEEIGCIKCHGLSAAHANDENVGATPPDVKFARHEVDKSCVECHDTHDAPARDVLARFLHRELPSDQPAICTDCHGEHRIVEAAETLELLGAGG
jgi:predicted CXXCH cytochrome family protein